MNDRLSPGNRIVRIFTIARLTHPRMMQLMGRPRYKARNPRRNAAAPPEYRNSANSTSVTTPARRHRRAKKNTVKIALNSPFHHTQFPAIPFAATIPVTARGVSAANVVATMLVPASHHETLRPPTKNSSAEPVARFRYQRPIRKLARKYAATTSQSIRVSFIGNPCAL